MSSFLSNAPQKTRYRSAKTNTLGAALEFDMRQFGLWEGVKRYNGFLADNPASEQCALEYVAKVQRVYEYQPASVSQSDVLQ